MRRASAYERDHGSGEARDRHQPCPHDTAAQQVDERDDHRPAGRPERGGGPADGVRAGRGEVPSEREVLVLVGVRQPRAPRERDDRTDDEHAGCEHRDRRDRTEPDPRPGRRVTRLGNLHPCLDRVSAARRERTGHCSGALGPPVPAAATGTLTAGERGPACPHVTVRRSRSWSSRTTAPSCSPGCSSRSRPRARASKGTRPSSPTTTPPTTSRGSSPVTVASASSRSGATPATRRASTPGSRRRAPPTRSSC